MRARNKLLLFLHSSFGNLYYLNLSVIFFYRYILVRGLRLYLKFKYPQLIDVKYRNSLTTPGSFNAFLSDIDIDLVLKDGSTYQEVVKTYLKIRSILIMLDSPEIYFQSEYNELNRLKKDCGELINLSWNIRKINWSLDYIKVSTEEIDKVKKRRSLQKSFSSILKNGTPNQSNIYRLEDFKILDKFVPQSSLEKNLCYWSFFLETNKQDHIQILINDSQFCHLNSLMPGEDIHPDIKDKVSSQYIANKNALEFYELQLSKSSMRLSISQSKDTFELQKWINYLEERSRLAEGKR